MNVIPPEIFDSFYKKNFRLHKKNIIQFDIKTKSNQKYN